MSPAPRRRGSKSADEPDKVEPKTPDAAEESAAKPKRPRRRTARKDDPAAASEGEQAASKAKAAGSEAKASDADAEPAEPVPARKPEPADEPVKTQGDKAADEDVLPGADEPGAEQAAPATTSKPRRARRAKGAEPPAPAPGRPARDPEASPPMVRAHAKYVRTSARKARLVCDHIRGKSVQEARAILAHANRDVARDWTKLLESAVANAEHNHELVGDELRIHAVKADEGPTLKRFRPRAMGRATQIRKRTSHLSITLAPNDEENH